MISLGQLKRKMRVNGTVPEKSVELLAVERISLRRKRRDCGRFTETVGC